ncbi:class I SAM-dependent methyltransferase [Nakamurella sp.]|uniref:class I SAM-dependent methyltransferase n=1 Tax=Nakamurella sp. TaxID=1869182 RepID=UPI0037852566
MTDTEMARSFLAPAQGYDALMGRYLPTLGPAFADAAGIGPHQRVLDVGCGPGGLTRELVARTGPGNVAAIEPSEPFGQACRERNPGVDVRAGIAEDLPFADAEFDAALACLVVGFMSDAAAGIAEMARVTRPGGVVAACFWDLAHMQMLRRFWAGAAELAGAGRGEVGLLGSREGDLFALLTGAGLTDVHEITIEARARYENFEDWWNPLTLGIGPAGLYVRSLDDEQRRAVRDACRRQFTAPDEPFTLDARAWCATGRRPSVSERAAPPASRPAPE